MSTLMALQALICWWHWDRWVPAALRRGRWPWACRRPGYEPWSLVWTPCRPVTCFLRSICQGQGTISPQFWRVLVFKTSFFQNFWHKNFFCYCFFFWRPGGITSCCGKLRVPQSYAERFSFFCAAMQNLLLYLFGAILMKTLAERHFLFVVWRSDSSQSWIHKTNIFAWYKKWFEFF